MIDRGLPTRLVARLLLVLLLACNLTFCLTINSVAAPTEQASSTCHRAAEPTDPAPSCPMNAGLAGSLAQLAAGLPWLLLPLLFSLILLAPPLGLATPLGLHAGRERGAPPPSWPRRHLELCVLRH